MMASSLFSSFFLSVSTVAVVMAAICISTVRLINHEQPQPYMDEIFHVPQAHNYCVGNYTHWDPMITTLPGLYLSSVLWVEPVARILSVPKESLCTTANLRFQNSLFLTLNFVLCCGIIRKLHTSMSTCAIILTAISIVTLPVLHFSSLLYYTDSGALATVLLAYSLSLSRYHYLAGLVSLVSVIFRQTNILWVVFVAGDAFLRNFQDSLFAFTKREILKLPLLTLTLLLPLWSYVAVGLTFALFLVWNGSVVVGDRSHHKMHLNLPQFFYFISFSLFFSLPYYLGVAPRMWQKMRRRRTWRMTVSLVCVLAAAILSVHFFTQVHPYLLADNRHYPFYVWRKVFQRHWSIKYLLTPFYSMATIYITHSLSSTQTPLWVALFGIVCAVVLVPQQLMEFRYFIIPHSILRLHLPPHSSITSTTSSSSSTSTTSSSSSSSFSSYSTTSSSSSTSTTSSLVVLLLEVLLNSLVNYLAIWIFLNIPVHWDNDLSTHRFMW